MVIFLFNELISSSFNFFSSSQKLKNSSALSLCLNRSSLQLTNQCGFIFKSIILMVQQSNTPSKQVPVMSVGLDET
tara:strand:- start:1121 stop:1348 length:228 start_codon:yes stop_codon:yes gene_type:complete